MTEAIVYALENIERDSQFTSLLSTKKLGYQIRDSCGDPVIEREIAYEFNEVALNYARNNSSGKRPVDIVISSFDGDSIKVLHILNIENIPQISFSKNNLKLLQDSTVDDNTVQNLISTYPENVMKIKAMVEIIEQFDFQYVYGVFSPDYQSKKAKDLLGELLQKRSRCETSFILNGESDIPKVVSELKTNDLITVLVIHCDKELEQKLLKALFDKSLSRFVILSTQDWSKSESSLKKFGPLVDGMLYLVQQQNIENFESRFKGILRPYNTRDWARRLYYFLGGTDVCMSVTVRDAGSEPCFNAEEQVKIELSNVASKAVYAYYSVYTIAHALLKGMF